MGAMLDLQVDPTGFSLARLSLHLSEAPTTGDLVIEFVDADGNDLVELADNNAQFRPPTSITLDGSDHYEVNVSPDVIRALYLHRTRLTVRLSVTGNQSVTLTQATLDVERLTTTENIVGLVADLMTGDGEMLVHDAQVVDLRGLAAGEYYLRCAIPME